MNVFDSIRLVYLFGKATGVFSYTISKNGIKLRAFDVVTHVVKALVEFSFLYMIQNVSVYEPMNSVEIQLEKFQFYFVVIISFVNATSCQLRYKTLRTIFDQINASDALLRKLGLRIDYKKHYKLSIRVLIVKFLIVLYTFVLNIISYKNLRLFNILVITYVLVKTMFLEWYFVFFLTDVQSRYALINEKLSSIESDEIFLIESNKNPDVFQDVVHIHGFLYRLCTKINKLFGVFITFNVGFVFASVVCTMYYNLDKDEFLSDKIKEQFMSISWVILSSVKLLVILWKIVYVTDEADKTISLLNDIYHKNVYDGSTRKMVNRWFILGEFSKKSI